jgi:hypothetical protein
MQEATRRRFTITDAMVLIAAMAAGLASMRVIFADNLVPPASFRLGWFLRGPSTCVAFSLAVALIVLRLRQPRPRRRRLVIQPGFVASAATVVSMILGGGCSLFYLVIHTVGPGETYSYPVNVHWAWAIATCPDFILGAWLALWLAGLWAPEPSWIDRAGRALGLFWIASVPWNLVAPIVWHFATV